MTDGTPAIEGQPATEELLAFIAAHRPDRNWRGPVLAALREAHGRGIAPGTAYLAILRIVCRPDGAPHELAQEFTSVLAPRPAGAAPVSEYERARAAKAPRKDPTAA